MSDSPKGYRPAYRAAICFVLFALTLAVFWPARQCDFINYDDPDYFIDNPLVQNGLTAEGVRTAFTTIPIGNWDPLVWLSYMVDVEVYGPGPAGPHLTNILLHAANAALLFLLLNTLTGAPWRSAMVAGLFALHPLRVESVAWITERKDVLSGLFALLTLLMYARHAKRQSVPTSNSPFTFHVSRFYFLALAFFALGLMSKVMLITLPFVMLLLDYWPLDRMTSENWRTRVRGLALEKIPFLLFALVVGSITFSIHQQTNALASLAQSSFASRLANAFVAYTCYMGKTFVPINLALPYPHVAWPVLVSTVSVALVVGGSFAVARQARHQPYLFTGWFWFIGMLVPVLGLVQWGDQSMADRFTYLPSIGFFILLVWTAGEAIAEWQVPKQLVAGGSIAALALCILGTRAQLSHWQNSETLFSHAIAVTDSNYVAHCNLGLTLVQSGRLDDAMEEFGKALALNPDHTMSLNNLGAGLFQQGKLPQAKLCITRALSIDAGDARTHFNLAQIHSAEGHAELAVEEYEIALKIKPAYIEAHKNLAVALLRLNKPDEAIQHLRFSLAQRPNDVEALNNLATALAVKGELDEAIKYFRAALRLAPDKPDSHFNLGHALLTQKHRDEAIQEFRETLRLKPDHARAKEQLKELAAELPK